jgi:cytochrome c553
MFQVRRRCLDHHERAATRPRRTAWLLVLLVAAVTISCRQERSSSPSSGTPADAAPAAVPVRSAADIHHNCQLCHSTREAQRGPILDGLPAWYVELQLRKFRDGLRGRNEANKSELLMGAGESILQDDNRRVAAHIAALPVPEHLRVVRGDAEKGRPLYAAQCASCHGARGEGKPELKAPPVNTLEDWYHLDQLRKFKSGLRGHHPQDVEGQIMRAAMAPVKEEDLRDIVRYVSERIGAGRAVVQ